MKVIVAIIATNRYKEFVPQLLCDIEKHFLADHEREIHLFTDEEKYYATTVPIVQHIIPSYGYPEATLLRYRIMSEHGYKSDYFFYLDADLRICDTVGDEFLVEIVAVRHPGYFATNGGSWETNKESQCYVKPEKREKYFAGAVQGGKTSLYIDIMDIMRCWIEHDLNKGIKPVWNDESAWNKFLTMCNFITEFNPSYCMAESIDKRKAWDIDKLEPKILALEKNLKEFWV